MSASKEQKPEGLGKYMKRMSRLFRRSNGGKTSSTANLRESTGDPGRIVDSPADAPIIEPLQDPIVTPMHQPMEPNVVHHWSAIQQDKARALFAKYGLTLEPGEWMSPRSDLAVQRVVKPIRVRVHRTCHRCETSFGRDKVCASCQHVRCKKCPRHPTKNSTDPVAAGAVPVPVPADANPVQPPKKKRTPPTQPVLKIPSRTGGQDLILKPVRQRVRRTCHLCSTVYAAHSKECEKCQHIRCRKCPRDPPNIKKYPDGYPGDVTPPYEKPQRVWRKPRMRVRYTCHECSTLYRSGEKICSACGEPKGTKSIRDPPKRVRPEFDPEVVRRVEERLRMLDIRRSESSA